jgi:hypothetical protein
VVARRPELELSDSDPWKVVVAMPKAAAERRTPPPGLEAAAGQEPSGDEEDLARQVVAVVRRRLEKSAQPLLMAKMAQEVVAELGEGVLASQWGGAGTFKALLESFSGHGIAIFSAAGLPAYLLDPERHTPPSQSDAQCRFSALPGDLAGLIQRIHSLTQTPDLTPGEYTEIFRSLEEVLQGAPYHFTGTSKMVRDRCIEKGLSISRATVSFILRGISYGGHRFGMRPEKDRASVFARVFRDNVVNLCADAELALNPADEGLLAHWISADADSGC